MIKSAKTSQSYSCSIINIQIQEIISVTEMVASQYLAVHITGFAEGSLIVMYEVSLKESIPGGVLGRELQTALTESSMLTVREGSLGVAPGKNL